ncbi:hypothetical protein GCM10025738_07540 [Microbacterium fluvii]
MDSRARLAFGGAATVAASVAVVCAVALSNGAALADSSGVTLTGARVVVPSASTAAAPAPSPSASASAEAPQIDHVDAPETVPAPEPVVVAPVAQTQTSPATSSTSTSSKSSTSSSSRSEKSRDESAGERGASDAVREWAQNQGWSQKRTAAWLEKVQATMGGDDARVGDRADRARQSSSDPTEESSASDRRSSHDGWRKGQSHDSPSDRD